MSGPHFLDALLAVGRLESDRAAEVGLLRRVQGARAVRSAAEAEDRERAAELAEQGITRIVAGGRGA